MGFHIRTKSAITKTCPAGMPNAPLGDERARETLVSVEPGRRDDDKDWGIQSRAAPC
jgi:hypothetical protein